MLIKRPDPIRPSEITSESNYLNRRQLMAGLAAGIALPACSPQAAELPAEGELANVAKSPYSTDETPNSYEDVTTYNNFYEFGTGKSDPAQNAHKLVTSPWSIKVDGMVDNPGEYSLADLLDGLPVEDRIYRFRCVEAWSMVIPWNGIELADILNKVGGQSRAKYVAFETVVQPENMIGVQRRVLDFPYVEGLRLDEAMHPLTIMATGIYGEPIANQTGAPIRLVVPWK